MVVMTLGLTGCQNGGQKATPGGDAPSQAAADSGAVSSEQSKPEDQDIQGNQNSRDGAYPPMEEAAADG